MSCRRVEASKGTAKADSSGNWSINLTGVTGGSHSYKAEATDGAGNASAWSELRTVTVDSTKPTVESTKPLNRATGVRQGATLTATFSEKMDAATITKSTFKLFKVNPDGSTTQVTDVVVTLSPDGLTATLDPFGSKLAVLTANTKYRATVTAKATDLVGNMLGTPKSWAFTTGSR